MRKLNFHQKWIFWIERILKSSRIPVLVNGSPSKQFSLERGLRQGDPLSPLLFNLMGEVLYCMLQKTEKAGIFRGIELGGQEGSISHLQYADDTVIFIKDNNESLAGVKRVLIGFEMLSGFRINFSKSKLYGFNNWREDLQNWASEIGCQLGDDSFQYLGLELSKSSARIQY